MIHGEGISFESDVLDLGAANAIVEKSGSWFSYKGERIGQGRDNARTYLKEHPELAQQLAGGNPPRAQHASAVEVGGAGSQAGVSRHRLSHSSRRAIAGST